MSTSEQSEVRTWMFARVLGPSLVIIPGTAVLRANDMRTILSEFAASPVWSWVAGSFILLTGLVVIALHQYWRSAAAIMVSVVGWIVVLKGLAMVAFPGSYLSFADTAVGAAGWWRAGMVAFVLIGLYLTYVGWIPARHRTVSHPAGATSDIPRAA